MKKIKLNKKKKKSCTLSSMRCSVLAGDVKAFSAIFSYSSQSLQQSKIVES